jgi:hypothetical protein
MQLNLQRQRDPSGLERSIVDWGIANQWDWDNVGFPEEIQTCAIGESQNGGYGNDPRLYDWRRWEEDLDAVDAFLDHDLYGQPGAELDLDELYAEHEAESGFSGE